MPVWYLATSFNDQGPFPSPSSEDFDNHDALGPLEEGQRVPKGTARLAHVLPCDRDFLGESDARPRGTTNAGRPALRMTLAGSRARNGFLVLLDIADDDEIGRPRLARNGFGRKVQDGSPFHPAIRPAARGGKLFSLLIEKSFHVL